MWSSLFIPAERRPISRGAISGSASRAKAAEPIPRASPAVFREECEVDRRQVIVLAGGLAAASSSVRAIAQSTPGTVTFGQSTPVLTLDSASGAFTGYPAGYEASLCIYDRLLDFDADMKIVPQL